MVVDAPNQLWVADITYIAIAARLVPHPTIAFLDHTNIMNPITESVYNVIKHSTYPGNPG